ncbi:hypothetical protein PR048_012377 [Dryococelus australis]|uniref:Uncharacterized protein n=1 Tax=Dryococelus australis TaxID=614101 RepID=A0ABQ9HP74_9NEOP|nr:hypothetical protein PR048_012377 [Dryococelus australis]
MAHKMASTKSSSQPCSPSLPFQPHPLEVALTRHQANRVQSPPRSVDFRMWESCRTMPFVSRFSRRSPISPTLSFQRCSILTSITLISSQDLAVQSRPNLFNHSFPMRVIELSMEQHQNENTGEIGDPREKPLTSGIVRHDSHTQKSGNEPAWN